jgi:trehalose 6-phosphate phosphatase
MDTHVLARFAAHHAEAGIFLDFDGTLSEIVHVPSEARPVEGAGRVLAELARIYRVVALVSGRSAQQLLDWLGPDIEIWGVHGAERMRGGKVEVSEHLRPFVDLMRRVHDDAVEQVQRLDLEGVIVEDKGVMVALHFRAARDRERARRALDELAERLAEEHGLFRAGGRLAFELRPPVELSKKAVVLERSAEEQLAAVAFFGDDRVDLPAFDALDELHRDLGTTTLRVAVDSDEAPPELLERADVVVSGPDEALELLRRLLLLAGG